MKKDLVRIIDCDVEFLRRVLELGAELKSRRRYPSLGKPLDGLAIATIYEKPSTRTKVSFEVGIRELGAQVVELTRQGSQLSRGETIADTAHTLERYVDAIVFRAFSHDSVTEMARRARVPVVNALTDLYHPCQVLSDLLTIEEACGTTEVPITFMGNGSNVAHSLLGAAAKLGLHLTIATPPTAMPLDWIVDEAVRAGRQTGAEIKLTNDPVAGVRGARVIYTDVWFDMGKDDPTPSRAGWRSTRASRLTPSCWETPPRMRSSCTACLRNAGGRRPTTSSTAPNPSSSARPRIACTSRKRSCVCFWTRTHSRH